MRNAIAQMFSAISKVFSAVERTANIIDIAAEIGENEMKAIAAEQTAIREARMSLPAPE